MSETRLSIHTDDKAIQTSIALLAACGFAYHARTLTTAHLCFSLRSSHGFNFEQKRDCPQSSSFLFISYNFIVQRTLWNYNIENGACEEEYTKVTLTAILK